MKQTPLHEAHVAGKAKIVDFSGWAMPLQYSGVLDEYHAVRSAAGLFDVSHMGRLHVEGPGALSFLQRVTTNDVQRVEPMGSQYSMICNPEGGVKDDISCIAWTPRRFFCVSTPPIVTRSGNGLSGNVMQRLFASRIDRKRWLNWRCRGLPQRQSCNHSCHQHSMG